MRLEPNAPKRAAEMVSLGESLRIERLLRRETVGGAILLVCAAAALILANGPFAAGYFAVRDLQLGVTVGEWRWGITVGHLATDGLLAIFFFLVGLELKREIVIGSLRDPRAAMLPVIAAMGGVIVPAVVSVMITAPHGPSAMRGWAVPVATDIAFALAVLAVVGASFPTALRTFLLTLAVVDDLIGIGIIAFVFPNDLQPGYLVAALLGVGCYGFIAQRYREFFRIRPTAAWLLLLPIGVVVWWLMLQSGIHATIAGVLLAFTIPVGVSRARSRLRPLPSGGADELGLATVFEHRFRPLSSGLAVPLFAFLAAGVAVGGVEGFATLMANPVAIAVTAALVLGKPIGIVGAVWLATRFRGIRLPDRVDWADMVGLGLLGGIGFTVSLLIAELAFGHTGVEADAAKLGVLIGSLVAAVVAGALLALRDRRHRRLAQHAAVDSGAESQS